MENMIKEPQFSSSPNFSIWGKLQIQMILKLFFPFFYLLLALPLLGQVKAGVDVLFEDPSYLSHIRGKRIGLVSNQTAVNGRREFTFDLFRNSENCQLVALFAPEHGFFGDLYADKKFADSKWEGISVYSLYGEHRRPQAEMLKGIDLIVFDIQEVGVRTYTYASTLFYVMEEAAKAQIPVLVLDRPNPLGGLLVDGPTLDLKYRSFIGYIAVPYCHGMTIGELARFFNEEYQVGAMLSVVPMRGWKREMTFRDTQLPWVPTSPNIPEPDTPFYYATTGLFGEFMLVANGIGYTLPFKVIGAPWLDARPFANKMNELHLPGVYFYPYHFRAFFGRFKGEPCQGVRIDIYDPSCYLPVVTQYALMGVLKALWPKQFQESMEELAQSKSRYENFMKSCGTDEVYKVMCTEKYFIWKLREKCENDREAFLIKRKKYLLPEYN